MNFNVFASRLQGLLRYVLLGSDLVHTFFMMFLSFMLASKVDLPIV